MDLRHKQHLTFDHFFFFYMLMNSAYVHICSFLLVLAREQLLTLRDSEGLEFYISLCMTTGPL